MQVASSRPFGLLSEAGAAGFSIEDYDPAADGIDSLDTAVRAGPRGG